jgi:hypothetical protein
VDLMAGTITEKILDKHLVEGEKKTRK